MYLICKGSSPIYMSQEATEEAAVADYQKSVILRYQHEELIVYPIQSNGEVMQLGWIHNT